MPFFLLLVIAAIVLGIVGVVAKGLLYLLIGGLAGAGSATSPAPTPRRKMRLN